MSVFSYGTWFYIIYCQCFLCHSFFLLFSFFSLNSRRRAECICIPIIFNLRGVLLTTVDPEAVCDLFCVLKIVLK